MQGDCIVQEPAHQIHLAHTRHKYQGPLRAVRLLRHVFVELARSPNPVRMRCICDVQWVRHRLRGQDLRAHMVGKLLRVQGGGHGGEVEVVAKQRDLHTHR